MSPQRTAAIVLRHFYLLRGSPTRLLPMFAWVIIDIVLWGFITRYLNQVAASGFNFVPALLGAVVLWDFFVRVMHGVNMAFLEDVWSRNFLNIFASPITIAEYVAGLVLSSIGTSAAVLAATILLAGAMFGLSLFVYGALLFPFLMVLFLSGIALGVVGCALVLRLGPAAEWLIWPIPALLSPFVGVFYPLSTLPKWMQYVGYFLPPSYVFEGVRSLVSGGSGSPAALAWGTCLAFLDIGLACWLFTAVHRRAVRTGIIARISAETAN